ncbi:preprotein translocase subunit SecA [Arenimonas sp.]|nr:preprotein translocase subunit SecA [Candidatus Parcubacteria bacterium]
MSFLNLLGSPIKKYQKKVAIINDFESTVSSLSDVELREKSLLLKSTLTGADKTKLDEYLPEAFALVREAAKRTLNQRHYDVQLIGGMILHDNNVAEMKTGEGKTQMATLPTYLNALVGKGVHVVTVNDYLSGRDAVWMGQIYYALGVSTAVIMQDKSFIYDLSHTTVKNDKKEDETGSFKIEYEFLRPCTRKEAYEADITYGTNSVFGFDYLFDNIANSKEELRQRGHYFAIIDEADSILIDESRSPLIVSQPAEESNDVYKTFASIVQDFKRDQHYIYDEKFKSIQVTDEGIDLAEKKLNITDLYNNENINLVHHLETAIKAKAIYHKEVDYLIKDGEVLIVDTSTGRVQPGRRWSDGIHQAIEAKEGVKIQRESKTAASITYQNLFRLYERLSGMTGTGMTSREEFIKVYGLDVVSVPTHKPLTRVDKDDLIFMTELGKFKAIAKKIKELNQKGQPVLVGTISIEKNELLSQYLKVAGVKHNLLNAKPELAEREGETIAQAGKNGAVTIATNMAGRGVDIKLGGTPSTSEQNQEIKDLGGLYVIGTERHDSRRVDNQLRGRSGRQGDAGETQFYVSLEDELMRVFANNTIKGLMARMQLPEDEAIQHKLVSRSLESAQKKIEGFHFDSRKRVLEFDDVLNQQRQNIYTRRKTILLGEGEVLKHIVDDMLVGQEIPENKKTDEFYKICKQVLLQIHDFYWMNHLDNMGHLQTSVNFRAIGQHDPIVEYKREGLIAFKQLNEKIKSDFIGNVTRLISQG